MNLEAQFASRLAAADDEGFLTMAELYFALSRDHVGNPRADCHWRAQACADEARVRGLARIVPQMWKRASGND